MLAWALGVVRAHPDHRVIIDVHELIDSNGAWAGPGETIYNLLRAEKNVELMTCGHHLGESRRSTLSRGTPFTRSSPTGSTSTRGAWGGCVSGASRRRTAPCSSGPTLLRSTRSSRATRAVSRRLRHEHRGSGVAPVAVQGDVAGTATATTAALDPATEYEWFVETKDACGQRAQSEVRSFSTL